MQSTTPVMTIIAERMHVCTSCGEPILPGDLFKRWMSLERGYALNAVHPECLEAEDDDAPLPYKGGCL